MAQNQRDTKPKDVKQFLLSFLFLILLLGLVQCNRLSSKNQNPVLGQYELAAYDNNGNLAFTGSITFKSLEQGHLIGQCTVVREKYAPLGVGEKNGRCEGMLDGKKLDMDYAPSMNDAGLLLEGELNDGRFEGIWKLDGFSASEPLGKFSAVKKR
jgi:hypothetical protein